MGSSTRTPNSQTSSEELMDQGKRLRLFFGRIDGSGKTIIRYDLIPSLQTNLSYVTFSLNILTMMPWLWKRISRKGGLNNSKVHVSMAREKDSWKSLVWIGSSQRTSRIVSKNFNRRSVEQLKGTKTLLQNPTFHGQCIQHS